MQYFIQIVREFNLKYGYPAPTTPTPTSEQQTKLRAKLIAEEVRELNEAWNTEPQDMKHIMKELCDVFYVLAGYYVENGNDAGDIVSRIMIEGNSTKSVNQNKALSLMVDFSVAMNGGHISIYNSVLEIEFNAALFASSIADQETIFRAFDAVHASNMSKGTNGVPVFNEHGKLMKGEDYKEADLSFLDL
jgi:predicted HAD superfamily Cof-like phosphohydrolase